MRRKRRKATAKTTQATASTAATAAPPRTSSAAKSGAVERDAPAKDASASKRGASATRATGAARATPTTPGGTSKRGSTTKRAGTAQRSGTAKQSSPATQSGAARTSRTRRGTARRDATAASAPDPSGDVAPERPAAPPDGDGDGATSSATSPGPVPTPQTDHDEHPSTIGHGSPAPDACSVQWDQDGTSAFGTAARARFFVVVEQPGPWGRDAARESHLDRELGLELDARTAGAGGRFMLMRRPGGHPVHDGPRRVLLAHAGTRPGEAWALAADVHHVGDLLGLDWASLSRGSEALVRASVPGAEPALPTLLVCTNGRRDVCCAVRGRPVAVHGGRVAPWRVWEVSHTGGHRFAPTAILLPWGQTLARLEDRHVEWVIGASDTGHIPVELLGPLHDRGRSPLDPAAQSAESHVRAALGETHLPALWAEASAPSDAGWSVRVTHADGRVWTTHVERVPNGRTRPESCGKQAVEVAEHLVSIISGPPLG